MHQATEVVVSETPSGQAVIAKMRSIRESGFNEAWLQEQIYLNPAALGLGELEAIQKEKIQANGAKLDILLKNPEDDSMYEVEIMLGGTDEKHIIRTIEYWDNERRRWPQRQHFAVLVAEKINRRFFNVIYLFGQNIPIIAIQANIVEINNQRALVFTTILDVYVGPEDEPLDDGVASEGDWQKRSPNTLMLAKRMLDVLKPSFPDVTLSFGKISIVIKSQGCVVFRFYKREKPGMIRLVFRVDENDGKEAEKLLGDVGATPKRAGGDFGVTLHEQILSKNPDTLFAIAKLTKAFRET